MFIVLQLFESFDIVRIKRYASCFLPRLNLLSSIHIFACRHKHDEKVRGWVHRHRFIQSIVKNRLWCQQGYGIILSICYVDWTLRWQWIVCTMRVRCCVYRKMHLSYSCLTWNKVSLHKSIACRWHVLTTVLLDSNFVCLLFQIRIWLYVQSTIEIPTDIIRSIQ
jgi:hypothetical protein